MSVKTTAVRRVYVPQSVDTHRVWSPASVEDDYDDYEDVSTQGNLLNDNIF
jgi:hypothetical protein